MFLYNTYFVLCKNMILTGIGLGSNLSSNVANAEKNPKTQIQSAILSIANLPNSHIQRVSPFYRTPALRAPDDLEPQPDYCNAALILATEYSPDDLLTALHQIEAAHGRFRIRHWAARTLDLDILWYGDLAIHTERLQIPHAGVAVRDFVLVPLMAICPEQMLPNLGQVNHLWQNLGAPTLPIWT